MLDVDVPVFKRMREGKPGDPFTGMNQRVELAVHRGFKLVQCGKDEDGERGD